MPQLTLMISVLWTWLSLPGKIALPIINSQITQATDQISTKE